MDNTAASLETWGGTPVVAAVWLLIGLGALLLPLLLEKRLVALMFKRAQATDAAQPAAPSEVPTTTRLQVAEVFAGTAIVGLEQARGEYRGRWIALFRKALWVDLAACAGYVGFTGAAVAASSVTADTAGPAWVLGMGYLVVCIARHRVHFPTFHTGDGQLAQPLKLSFGGALHTALRGPWGWVMMLFTHLLMLPLMRPWLAAVCVLLATTLAFEMFDEGAHGVGWALLAAALLHAVATVWFVWWVQRHAGLKLLVLRVFGVDDKARFTFGNVLAVWGFFGSYFTVIDPSYWRHANKLWSGGAVTRVLGTLLLLLLLYAVGDEMARAFGSPVLGTLALPMAGVVMLGFIGFVAWRGVDGQCIRSREHLLQVVRGLERRPRSANVAFRNLTVPCHDDTWKIAVDEFTQRSHVVLMDLRGFSEARKGCAFEVNFLLDRLPIEQVVFLIDRSSDRELVGTLIAECWRVLDVNSPNLANNAPQATLYAAGEEDEEDVQGLLNLLLTVAGRTAASA